MFFLIPLCRFGGGSYHLFTCPPVALVAIASVGTPINKRPVLGYRNLNLFKLYRLVHKLGGFDNVSGLLSVPPLPVLSACAHRRRGLVGTDRKRLGVEAGLPGPRDPHPQLSCRLQRQMCLPQVSRRAALPRVLKDQEQRSEPFLIQVLVRIRGILHLHRHHLQDGPPFKAERQGGGEG